MGSSDISSASSASTSTFTTALVFNAIVFAAELTAFTALRRFFPAIYQPLARPTLLPASRRSPPLSPSLFSWPLRVFQADYHRIIKTNGVDAYFFVRFLRMMVKILLPIWFVSWAVLLPVTSVKTSTLVGGDGSAGSGTKGTGLDKLVFGNVGKGDQARYAAHIICVWIFTAYILYTLRTETRHFILTRQQHLISPAHARTTQASTLLVTGVPEKYLTHEALERVFGVLPGGVRGVWVNRNLKSLPEIYARREKACAKLEGAETKLLGGAAKTRLKGIKAENKGKKGGKGDNNTDPQYPVADPESPTNPSSIPTVPPSARPTHKLGFLGLLGEKVDTIDWAREEIRVCNALLHEGREKLGSGERAFNERQDAKGVSATPHQGHDAQFEDPNETVWDNEAGRGAYVSPTQRAATLAKAPVSLLSSAAGKAKGAALSAIGKGEDNGEYPALNSAFILFRRQVAAHMGSQVLVHHEPYRMSERYIEVKPGDVIWANLGLNPYEMKVRKAISWALTAGLIILWAFPVAFVGIVSNVHTLCETASWLAWICTLPDVVVGIISGILPPVLLAVLMMLLPIILRLLARFEGIPQRSGVELSLMTRFFIFQVIHSFLIVTISAGIIASLGPLLKDPTSVPNLLATNLPQASTFFLTYIILQGLSGTAGGFLQIVPLILYYVKLFILGSTPRSVWGIKYGKRSVAWGTAWPGITLLVVITLGYSIISPIINGLACATFFLFYMLYKYLFLWSYDQSDTADTGGLFFPKAINHVFVGLYVQQVCLCALFFLARDDQLNASAIPEGALMVVLIVFTAAFHLVHNNSFGPLIHALPLSLVDKMYAAPAHDEEVKGEDIEGHRASGDFKKEEHQMERRSTQIARGDSGGADTLESDRSGKAPLRRRVSARQNLNGSDVSGRDVNGSDTVDRNGKERDGRQASQHARPKSEDEYGFVHPAASRPQKTIWIPRDTLGLSEEEERACREAGVDVSTEGAVMNEKGKVDVSGAPPDVYYEDEEA